MSATATITLDFTDSGQTHTLRGRVTLTGDRVLVEPAGHLRVGLSYDAAVRALALALTDGRCSAGRKIDTAIARGATVLGA